MGNYLIFVIIFNFTLLICKFCEIIIVCKLFIPILIGYTFSKFKGLLYTYLLNLRISNCTASYFLLRYFTFVANCKIAIIHNIYLNVIEQISRSVLLALIAIMSYLHRTDIYFNHSFFQIVQLSNFEIIIKIYLLI